MKEVIAVFIYVYPDLISLDLSRKVLKCYGMAAMCEYTISNKNIQYINFYAQLSYVQLGFFVFNEYFLKYCS